MAQMCCRVKEDDAMLQGVKPCRAGVIYRKGLRTVDKVNRKNESKFEK